MTSKQQLLLLASKVLAKLRGKDEVRVGMGREYGKTDGGKLTLMVGLVLKYYRRIFNYQYFADQSSFIKDMKTINSVSY